jgi:hypothetical protein
LRIGVNSDDSSRLVRADEPVSIDEKLEEIARAGKIRRAREVISGKPVDRHFEADRGVDDGDVAAVPHDAGAGYGLRPME